MFGYLGYDLKNTVEDLSSRNRKIGSYPDLYMMAPRIVIAVRQGEGMQEIQGTLPASVAASADMKFQIGEVRHLPEEDYVSMIKDAKKGIREGAYYEINLSHPLEFLFEGDAYGLYQKMKERAPVPFGAYLSIGGRHVCCMSPERFLKKEGDVLTSQPIKGTVANTGTEDPEWIREVLLTEKNKAENLMIVDLVRNDLNRVSQPGSVEVKDLFEIQSFGTVHQMVSTIRSRQHESCDEIDVIKACFPMGSMTGAPKIAAMKEIEQLEMYRRSVYSGAIGYFTPDGDFDLNVVIRTALIEEDRLCYPVGGAITGDSDPADEWEETWVKARALTDVI
jgi:para-aminobenzoate synthetase component 1